jgi:Tol biopolymer transport system component
MRRLLALLVFGLGAPLLAPGSPLAPEPAGPLARLGAALEARNVTRTPAHNEWNPRFSPDGTRLAFERRDGSAQAIFVVDAEAPAAPERVSSRPPRGPAGPEEALLGGARSDDSFNAQLSFFPDGRRFVFTGNGGSGVYRLYQGALGRGTPPQAMTEASKEDGHPAVSPDGQWLVYVSARGGLGKLFLRDLATGAERQLTSGDNVDLYPAWSPDSKSVAYTSGDNDNHDVSIIHGVTGPGAVSRQLTEWRFDDLRPTFSADGTLIAFYSSYSATGEEKEWSIVTVPADGSGPTKGSGLADRAVAENVVKDPEVGPAWLPWGHAIVYAHNLKAEWNPISVVDVRSRHGRRLETGTRMNHDLTCSRRGALAFRAQVASWDDIFLARLEPTP